MRQKLKILEEAVTNEKQKIINEIKARLSDSGALREALTALESSTELTGVENDDFLHTWIRFDASKVIDVKDSLEVEALEELLSEDSSAYLDLKNDCLTSCIGPAVIFCDDGSVYDQDSRKQIIGKNSRDLEVIKRAVRIWQNKQGVFNWAVKESDRGSWYSAILIK